MNGVAFAIAVSLVSIVGMVVATFAVRWAMTRFHWLPAHRYWVSILIALVVMILPSLFGGPALLRANFLIFGPSAGILLGIELLRHKFFKGPKKIHG